MYTLAAAMDERITLLVTMDAQDPLHGHWGYYGQSACPVDSKSRVVTSRRTIVTISCEGRHGRGCMGKSPGVTER